MPLPSSCFSPTWGAGTERGGASRSVHRDYQALPTREPGQSTSREARQWFFFKSHFSPASAASGTSYGNQFSVPSHHLCGGGPHAFQAHRRSILRAIRFSGPGAGCGGLGS